MKGLSFTAELVKAILEGRKTQTRRLIKPQPLKSYKFVGWKNIYEFAIFEDCLGHRLFKKPRYKPGGTVYLKETWADLGDKHIVWKADHREGILSTGFMLANGKIFEGMPKWKSPRFMPEWASRRKSKITGVGVERLQDISEADCFKEGISKIPLLPGVIIYPKVQFQQLWDSINKEYPWESNPYIFVYKFKQVKEVNNGQKS